MNRLMLLGVRLALLGALTAGLGLGCKKDAGDAPADDGGSGDLAGEQLATPCPEVDGGASADGGGTLPGTDEFGFNAPAAKIASSLGRVNIFEVTTPVLLERVDIFLRADLTHTRLTIAIQEATSRTTAFTKLTDVQIDMPTCEGWASSGPLAVPLKVGRFYAVGFDPNQPVTSFVSTDGETLPIDGMFGRLIGSRTATTVSVPTITWEKFLDKEYNRQRIVTSPRAADPVTPDAGATDAAGSDAHPG